LRSAVTRLRDALRLRTRLRKIQTLYWPEQYVPAPTPRLDVDPARVAKFAEFRPEFPGHAAVFLRDVQGLSGQVQEDAVHLRAVLDWLLRAQQVTKCGGFSVGYSFAHGWFPAYPETTGYIIPTLWDAFHRFDDMRYRDAAIAAAAWERDIQLSSGAVKAGYEGKDPDRFWENDGAPAAFNTGQVMQ